MSNRGNTACFAVWGCMGTKEDDKHNGHNELQPIDKLRDQTVEEYRSRSGRSGQQGLAVLGAGCAGVRGSGRALPRLIAPCVHGSSASCQVSSRLSYTSERRERGHHPLTRVTSGMHGGHPLQFSEGWPLRKVADYCVDWCADPQKKTPCSWSPSPGTVTNFIAVCLLYLALLALSCGSLANKFLGEDGISLSAVAQLTRRSHCVRGVVRLSTAPSACVCALFRRPIIKPHIQRFELQVYVRSC